MKKIFILLIFCFVIVKGYSHDYPTHFLHDHNFASMPSFLENESIFVSIPTYSGGLLLGIPSYCAGLCLGIPYAFFKIGYVINNINDPILGDYSMPCASIDIGYRLGQYILGTPFYCIKKSLWDFPIYLYNLIIKKEEKSNESVEVTMKPSGDLSKEKEEK